MPVRFSIEEIKLLNVEYSTNESCESNNDDSEESNNVPIPIEISCKTNFDKKNMNLKVILGISCKDQSMPFLFNVEIGGKFNFKSEPKNGELDKLANINCPSIIFPFLREFVSDLVRRGGNAPIFLPPVNFLELYKRSKSKEK